jgi:hypothetical protein
VIRKETLHAPLATNESKALWHQGSDAQLVADARLSSRVTHGHVRSQMCCALYCPWARQIMQDAREPWDAALTALEMLWLRTQKRAQSEAASKAFPCGGDRHCEAASLRIR